MVLWGISTRRTLSSPVPWLHECRSHHTWSRPDVSTGTDHSGPSSRNRDHIVSCHRLTRHILAQSSHVDVIFFLNKPGKTTFEMDITHPRSSSEYRWPIDHSWSDFCPFYRVRNPLSPYFCFVHTSPHVTPFIIQLCINVTLKTNPPPLSYPVSATFLVTHFSTFSTLMMILLQTWRESGEKVLHLNYDAQGNDM